MKAGRFWFVLAIALSGCQWLLGIGDTDLAGPEVAQLGGASGEGAGAALGAGSSSAGDPSFPPSHAGGGFAEGGAGGAKPPDPRPEAGTVGVLNGEGGAGGERPAPIPGMVYLPGGTFAMGSDLRADSLPTHAATVDAFYLDIHEVTVGEYRKCVEAGVCQAANSAPGVAEPRVCNYPLPDREEHPINCNTGNDAIAFCKRLGKRLPTEEEWEYAAFGGNTRTFPWGNELPDATRVNVDDEQSQDAWLPDEYKTTAPVGSFPDGATPEGVQDMAGNVWEWIGSYHCTYKAEPCKSCPLDDLSCENPCNVCNYELLVLRGGAWTDHPRLDSVVSSLHWRGESDRHGGNDYIGFRCAKSANESQ